MSYKNKSLWLATAALVLVVHALAAPLAYGQAATFSRLLGTVRDGTGAVVPGVEVTATATATNIPAMAVTNDRGDYVIDKLIPGFYDISAELPGFKVARSLGIRLEVQTVSRVDLTMEPGDISEQVTVTGQSTIIDTDNAEVAAVIEEKKILDLPLAGRDMVKLAYLTTGGTQERQEIGYSTLYAYGGGYPTFNGLYSHSNQIQLDGSNNMGYITQRPTVQPTPETVQEFKVITNNYSAEYGRVGGAVITMLSKSGSNEFHGHAWYYFRDEGLDAANFFQNRSGLQKLPVDYHIGGGSIGGPVLKDKTFFHAHYEKFVDNLQVSGFATAPSTAIIAGDFSGSGAKGPINQLYNPFDFSGSRDDATGMRAPFANNQIPASMQGAVYKKMMELMPPPAPNQAGELTSNYAYPRATNTKIDKYSFRVDHQFGNDDNIFGRYSWQRSPTYTHTGNWGVPGAEQDGIYRQFQDRSRGYQIGISWVNPIGSNLVTEYTQSIWKFTWLISRPIEDTNWPRVLGFDDGANWEVYLPNGNRGGANMPRMSPSGYTGWGGATESPLADWGLGFKYTASWRKGDHYLKFGVEHVRNLDVHYYWIPPYAAGGDSFNGFATGQLQYNPDGSFAGVTEGEGWADLMLGTPSSVFGNVLGIGENTGHFNQSHYNWFINDDWKVGPNLTLNIGVRWEQPRPPYYEGHPNGSYTEDYYYCGYDYTRANGRIDPVQMMPQNFDIAQWQGSVGIAVPFDNLPHRGCYKAKWRYFAPRFGLAWRMFGTNRTVLRAGAGLTYDQEFGILRARVMRPNVGVINLPAVRGEAVPSLISGIRLNLPRDTGAVNDDGIRVNSNYRTCYFSELDWQEGQVYSYNLMIQHELFQGTKWEIGYVGNQGRHIREISPFNVAMPEGYVVPLIGGGSAAVTSDTITAGPREWIPAETRGEIGREWNGQLARRPYPQVIPNTMLRPHGSMNYNSLQTKLERRFSDGLALSMGYTWSKAMAMNYNGNWGDWSGSRDYERHALRAPMQHDRSSTYYMSAIWVLPFFQNAGGITNSLLGGWELTGIATLTTGAPFRVFYGTDLWNQGGRSRRYTDRLKDGSLGGGATVERWYDTSAFTAPGVENPDVPGQRIMDRSLCGGANFCHEAARRALGNGAPYPLRYDGVPLVDLSLHKNFALGEDRTFDVRADFFNAFNHAVFNAPNGNHASGGVGRVTSAATARQIQIGFRFSF